MVNCNPETVSTDYDTSDRLFFEPLTIEDVRNVCDSLQERAPEGGGELTGVVVALGGQTPLKLAHALEEAGIPVLGTSPDSIDLAEDRDRFNALCERLGIPQPAGGTASDAEQRAGDRQRASATRCWSARRTCSAAARCRSCTTTTSWPRAMDELAVHGTLGREGGLSAERPALIDRFIEDAVEVDVDALRDAHRRGRSSAASWSTSRRPACTPATPRARSRRRRSPRRRSRRIEEYTARLADALDVRGLLNVQYAVKDGAVFVIEANPRASRTVPFVSKATGVPLAKVAARIMVGATLAELRDEGPGAPAGRGWPRRR